MLQFYDHAARLQVLVRERLIRKVDWPGWYLPGDECLDPLIRRSRLKNPFQQWHQLRPVFIALGIGREARVLHDRLLYLQDLAELLPERLGAPGADDDLVVCAHRLVRRNRWMQVAD